MADNNSQTAFAVIMAGGKGERFWPQSRLSHPKQLLRLLGNFTLIEQTVERLHAVFSYEQILIITTEDYVAPMRAMLPNLPPDNIVSEPAGRDTGPCMAFAVAHIRKLSQDPDPVICVVPSDHVIHDTDAYAKQVSECIAYASEYKRIVTIGVSPTFPSTGFGYIRIGNREPVSASSTFYQSLGFKEKPSLSLAEQYYRDGEYLWNSGMFLFRASVLIQAFRSAAPELFAFYESVSSVLARKAKTTLEDLYGSVQKISIDYGVMEKIPNITVAKAAFDWDDIGTWTSMRNQLRSEEGENATLGMHVGLDTDNCVIVGSADHLVATVGVHDLIIVHTDDATLVCDAKSAQRVKELVQLIASKPELETFL